MKKTTQKALTTADIAREAFRLLGTRRAAPTPEAYKAAFNEIAGITDTEEKVSHQTSAETQPIDNDGAIAILENFAQILAHSEGAISTQGKNLLQALQKQDWVQYENLLNKISKKYIVEHKNPPAVAASKKIETLSAQPITPSELTVELRNLLCRTLSFGMASLLQDDQALSVEALKLSEDIKKAETDAALTKINTRLKQLCFKIEMKGSNISEQQDMLLRLFKLLINNISELIDDDSWLKGQIEVLQEMTAGPINYRMLEDTETSLKEVIYKQSLLKHSLVEAKDSLKKMMINFIDRLGSMATSTGQYHEKMHNLSSQISNTNNILELNGILATIMQETQSIQVDALDSLNKMNEVRAQVDEAEKRIKDLESQLDQMSELVHEDKLTGSLNRRGLDDAFDREIARSERNDTPLCMALLDLDDFKVLNDKHGHLAGDDALIHLVRVVKNTLRPTDVIARFGGEEFVILLPETELDEGVRTLQRVQRELTKHFFLHNNERLLITFSAGVALRKPDEDKDMFTTRADAAMYKAKRAGKNCVFAAE